MLATAWAGLDPAKPPATFDELLAAATKISASGEGRFGCSIDTAPNAQTGGAGYLGQKAPAQAAAAATKAAQVILERELKKG